MASSCTKARYRELPPSPVEAAHIEREEDSRENNIHFSLSLSLSLSSPSRGDSKFPHPLYSGITENEREIETVAGVSLSETTHRRGEKVSSPFGRGAIKKKEGERERV